MIIILYSLLGYYLGTAFATNDSAAATFFAALLFVLAPFVEHMRS